MNRLRRVIAINFTLARYGLDEILSPLPFFRPLRWLSWVNPFNWFRSDHLTRAERLRLCIEDLGPIFIKFGQMLSTRRDLLPDDIIEELEKLLDRVPPFPLQQALESGALHRGRPRRPELQVEGREADAGRPRAGRRSPVCSNRKP